MNFEGRFSGQGGYGYKSIETFVDAVNRVRSGQAKPEEFDDLPTLTSTVVGTAVLEAGRRSLDSNGKAILITYASHESTVPIDLVAE